jgi:ferredoxin
VPHCRGGANAAERYIYSGLKDCRAAAALLGGPKKCPSGCIGLGTCVTVCPFNAISMGKTACRAWIRINAAPAVSASAFVPNACFRSGRKSRRSLWRAVLSIPPRSSVDTASLPALPAGAARKPADTGR